MTDITAVLASETVKFPQSCCSRLYISDRKYIYGVQTDRLYIFFAHRTLRIAYLYRFWLLRICQRGTISIAFRLSEGGDRDKKIQNSLWWIKLVRIFLNMLSLDGHPLIPSVDVTLASLSYRMDFVDLPLEGASQN